MNNVYIKAWELVIRNAKKQILWQLLQIQYHKKNLGSLSESSWSSVFAQDPMATWALNICRLVLCWRWLISSLPMENACSASIEDAIEKV
jgi:hypothetical protein